MSKKAFIPESVTGCVKKRKGKESYQQGNLIKKDFSKFFLNKEDQSQQQDVELVLRSFDMLFSGLESI